LIERTISAADLAGVAARAAQGRTGDVAAIDEIARQLHLTRDGLTGMLARLGASDLSNRQLTGQLTRLTHARNEMLLIRLATVPNANPEIHALREQAAKALQDGQEERAEMLIASAEQPSNATGSGRLTVQEAAFRDGPPPVAPIIQPAQAAPQEDVNLFAPDQGGELLTAPREDWALLVKADGHAWSYPGEEAVFGFRDGKSAKFSKFAILIPQSDPSNVKEFELLAGNDEPTGEFHSLGKFTTRNIRMMKAPFQEFGFLETTAKFFKFRVLSAYNGGNAYVYQVQLLGRIEP
jgi:hypothetical protein